LSLVDHDFRFLRINATLAAFNRLPVAEHVGQLISDVLPALWPQIEPYYRRVLETGQSVLNVEVQGSSGVFLESYYPVAVHGELSGVGAIVVPERNADRPTR
jgi:PAS domain-containing protein